MIRFLRVCRHPCYRLLLCLTIGLLTSSCGSKSDSVKQAAETAPVFNVPDLLGLDIDRVESKLGRPKWDSVAAHDASESVRLFRRDTLLLRVGYSARTRRVYSYLIQSAHAQTHDYRPLLRLANLTGNEPVLVVVPVPSKNNSAEYTGVKVFVKDAGSR
ncbi:hypothetical protein ABIB60_003892 [Hymenobacter sp. UYP22]